MSDTHGAGAAGGDAGAAAAAKAKELKEAIRKLDFRDRVIFLGSAALVILFFLPWYRVKVEMLGMSKSTSGLVDACWIGFIAACVGVVAGLANMGFIPLSPERKRLAGSTVVQLGVASAALLLGPLYFLSQTEEAGVEMLGMAEAGKTLFFWLALLVAAAAAGCAAWKLADERKKAGAGGPTA